MKTSFVPSTSKKLLSVKWILLTPRMKGVGRVNGISLTIPMKNNTPRIIQPQRRIAFHYLPPMEKILSDLLVHDVIERVPPDHVSKFVSPSHLVPKKDPNAFRLVVDMRQVNQFVEEVMYPIPLVEDCLAQFNGSVVFSKIDFNLFFHQHAIAPESRDVGTFSTPFGLFRYKVLFFGLSCSPELAYSTVRSITHNLKNFVLMWDDGVVYGKDQATHDKALHRVLKTLQQANYTLNLKKCQFSVPEIEFMGRKVSSKGYQPSEHSLQAIKSFREPTSSEEVHSFLGLANFCSVFIPNFATVAEPLRRLTRKGVNFSWTEEQRKSFAALKDALSSKSLLAYFDPSACTTLVVDASPVGLGAVLYQHSQSKGQSTNRIITFASRSLTPLERKYSQTEKEALALVWGCEKLAMYLLGCSFKLVTDHKALEFIFKPTSKPCARVERWVLRLMPFKYSVVYKPGKTNIADCLSRLSTNPDEKDDVSEEWIVQTLVANMTPKCISLEELQNATKSDEVLSTICTSLYSDNWPPSLKRYELIKSELGEVDGVLVKNSSLIIPKSLQTRVLTLAHEGHMGIVATKQRLRSKVWWDGIHKDAENWVRSCHPCQLVQEGTNSEPLQPSPLPKTCWEVVSCDYLGPLPTGDYLLVIVCYYSRYIEVLSTKKITAEKTIECLEYVFSRWGYPFVLVTDNGPCFIAHEFQEYLQNVGVAHRAVTPLWPQANGEVERQNRTILKRLKIAHSEGKKWKPELQSFLFAYRTTPHSVTRVAPLELMTGRKIKDKIPSLNFSRSPLQDEEVRDRDELAKAKNKEYADRTRHATPSSLVPGDSVLLQQKKMDKLSTRFESSPFTLLQKAGSKTWIQSEEGKVFQRNSSLVKPYVDRSSLFPEIGAAGPSVVNPTSPVQENQDVPSSEVPSASPSHATNPQPEAAGIPAASTTPHRPVRNRRLPSHLRDFILNCIYTF